MPGPINWEILDSSLTDVLASGTADAERHRAGHHPGNLPVHPSLRTLPGNLRHARNRRCPPPSDAEKAHTADKRTRHAAAQGAHR